MAWTAKTGGWVRDPDQVNDAFQIRRELDDLETRLTDGFDTVVGGGQAINLTNVAGLSLRDQAGDNVYELNQWTGQRWDLRRGTGGSPTQGGGPGVKISQTENITNLATQMGGNKVDNEANAALLVDVKSITGSLGQPCAIAALAHGAPTNTDVVGLWAGGRVTGGSGIGTGAYIGGQRETAGSRALSAEFRVGNYGGAPSTVNPAGISETSGIWVSAAGGQKVGAGVALGSTDGGTTRYDAGYHVTQNSVDRFSFLDESGSDASFRSVGTHDFGLDLYDGTFTAGYAIRLPNATASWAGIAYGNDIFTFRLAPGWLRISATDVEITGKLYLSGKGEGWAAATGTGSKATFDTATVTTAQLAQRVKSIVDDMLTMGLFRT